MVEALRYWKGNNDDRVLMEAAEQERRERKAMATQNTNYYYGIHRRPLKPNKNGTDSNIIINLQRPAADHTIGFAAHTFPEINPSQADSSKKDEINLLWKANDEAVWLANAMLIGYLMGDAYVGVMPPDENESDEDPQPEFVLYNPANIITFVNSEDYCKELWHEITYMSGKAKRRRDVIAPGVVDNTNWRIIDYKQNETNGWLPISTVDWPFRHGPIVHWQHLPKVFSYYGDHEMHTIELNDQLNKVASDIKQILRVHASPRLFGSGFSGAAIADTAIDAFWTVENPDAKVTVLEMQSDLASSMAFLNLLRNEIYQQSRVTILTGGPDAYKGVTNLGIKAAFMSQLTKTEVLQRQYGNGIAELTEAAMEMKGMMLADCPEVHWSSALPVSELEDTQVVQAQIDMGLLSKKTASGELGIDYETEQEQMQAEGDTTAGMFEQLINRGGFGVRQMPPQPPNGNNGNMGAMNG